jgi:hypothetical protein
VTHAAVASSLDLESATITNVSGSEIGISG